MIFSPIFGPSDRDVGFSLLSTMLNIDVEGYLVPSTQEENYAVAPCLINFLIQSFFPFYIFTFMGKNTFV